MIGSPHVSKSKSRTAAKSKKPAVPPRMQAVNDKMRAIGYIPVKEAAGIAGSSVVTIRRWIEAGSIRGTTVGYLRFVDPASLATHLGAEYSAAIGLDKLVKQLPRVPRASRS